MTKDEKIFLLTGFMFIAVFFLLLIALNVFITNAAAYALLVSALTYLFFDKLFYAQKKTETHGNEYQSVVKKITT